MTTWPPRWSEPTEAGWQHPRLGVAALRESWPPAGLPDPDPLTVPEDEPRSINRLCRQRLLLALFAAVVIAAIWWRYGHG